MNAFEKLSQPKCSSIDDIVNAIVIGLNIGFDFIEYGQCITEDEWGKYISIYRSKFVGNVNVITIIIYFGYISNTAISIKKIAPSDGSAIQIYFKRMEIHSFDTVFNEIIDIITTILNRDEYKRI